MRASRSALRMLLAVIALASLAACVDVESSGDKSKVLIIDNSRLLNKDEVDKLASSKHELPVAVPVAAASEQKIRPKIGTVVDLTKSDDSEQANTNDAKLPPMPLIMPPFLSGLFGQPIVDPMPVDAVQPVDAAKPKGIVSVLLIKSHRVEDANNAPQQSDDSAQPKSSSSFVILRYLPKSVSDWFGGNGNDDADKKRTVPLLGGRDDPDNKRMHMMGGDDDPDHKRMHMMGGSDDPDHRRMHMHMLGGNDDPDRMRLDMDEAHKGVFTGGNQAVYGNANNVDQHKFFAVSMFEHMRAMFDNIRARFEQPMVEPEAGPAASNLVDSMPFISIRTDDGQSALIPNDIGYAEKQQHEQSLNKCMMLQFMRLKASMYYRTILHLLFVTGVLLFVFSLLMLSVRVCRRRRLACRHRRLAHQANMVISSIEAGKSKLAAYKAWQGLDQSSLIEPSDKVVLIQAPPAYDQVFIQDKNSTLTSSSAVRQSFACQDECETKSLPPEYEEKPAQP